MTDRTDTELLACAVRLAGNGSVKVMPRWAHVRDQFGIGSTSAIALCRRFDVDPDAAIGGCAECYERWERDQAEFLASIAKDCTCCEVCSPGVCGGVQQGSVCDQMCSCSDDDLEAA